jgi:hypothetical protein
MLIEIVVPDLPEFSSGAVAVIEDIGEDRIFEAGQILFSLHVPGKKLKLLQIFQER